MSVSVRTLLAGELLQAQNVCCGLLHPTRDIQKFKSTLSKAPFSGTIVQNDDSQHPDGKKRQRCQIRVDQLHPETQDSDLPWALPRHGHGATANAGGGTGGVDVPPVGAKVWCHYDEEDPHIIHYEHSPPTDDVLQNHEGYTQDYPNTKSHVDWYGNMQSVNNKQGTITDTAKSGATIFRDKDGNGMLWFPGNFSIGCGGDMTLASKGAFNAHAQGVNSIKGSTVKLNCSDSAKTPLEVGARQTPTLNTPQQPQGLSNT